MYLFPGLQGFSFAYFFFFYLFIWVSLRHMAVPRSGIESKLQLQPTPQLKHRQILTCCTTAGTPAYLFLPRTFWGSIIISILWFGNQGSGHRNGQKNPWKDVRHHLLLEKCKSKLLWGTTLHQPEWPSSKILQAVSAGEGVEKREPSYTVGGNVNWCNYCGKLYGDS